MDKSRTLSTDLGDRSDGRYYASTAGIWIPSATWTYLQKNYEWEYARARSLASSSIAGPQGLGSERMQGTSYGRPRFNELRHEKRVGFNYPYFLCTLATGTQYGAWQPYMRMATTGSFGNIPAHLVATWADVDGCQRRAWWSMQPRFESEISFLNFIYEMKDFKSLAKNAINFRRTGDKLRRAVQSMRGMINPLSPGTTLSGASKVGAKGWLTFQFAIKPLISDVAELIKIWKNTINGAQDEFSARGLDHQISHYTESLGNYTTGTWGTGAGNWMFTGSRQAASFTATLEYTYSYIRRYGYDMLSKYLGTNLTAGVIWEAIPFSFLADYFCQIGNAIHMMSVDPNVKLNVLQYSESILHEAHYGKACNPLATSVKIFYAPSVNGGKGFTPTSTYVPLMGYQDTIYERKIAHPNKGTALPRFRVPGSTQVWNMVALVRSMMK